MKVRSIYVGAKTATYEYPVDKRLTMNYAAGIGDNNPLYFDDLDDERLLAPPLSALAVTWPISGDFIRTWNRGSFDTPFPYEIMQKQVLFSEGVIWHEVLRPGQSVFIHGEMVAILPHRAGTHLAVRYIAENSDGRPVFTEYVGALLRGVRCEDGGTGAENLPVVPECPAEEPAWEERLSIDPLAGHVFDGCSNMYFPIHTSERFAREVGLKGTLLQGAATLSIAARELTDKELDRDPSRLASLHGAFTGMVTPGSEIAVRLLHREEDVEGNGVLFFDVLNAQGRAAISNGYMKVRPSQLTEGHESGKAGD